MLGMLGGGGFLGVAMSMLLAQLGRDLGKKKEAELFAAWGGTPTTLLLRRRPSALPEGLRLNPEARERVRQQLPDLLPDLPLPTIEQETSNPDAADERFGAIVAELRGRTYDTKKFGLLFAENCGYGFRRNLWAMRPVGLLLAVGSTLAAAALLAVAPGANRSAPARGIAGVRTAHGRVVGPAHQRRLGQGRGFRVRATTTDDGAGVGVGEDGSMRSITFFKVENKGRSGNCALVDIDGFLIVVDLCGAAGDKSSWDLLKPMLRKKDGKYHVDVLCITHGDEDHCGGYETWQKEVDDDNLVIGAIWHPNYDRTKVAKKKDLPDDYLALHKEIVRRRKASGGALGDIEVPLSAGDTEKEAFKGLQLPKNVALHVLNPHKAEDDEADWDVNDLSLVFRLEVSGLKVLFTGDSSSEIWQDSIIPNVLKKKGKESWADSDLLVVSHHGSASFFGKSREEVRDADPQPDNYEALDKIKPAELLISATTKFPTSGDSSGDHPPHYAAYKWYHKWFQDNRKVKEDTAHPPVFRYAASGHRRLEHASGKWSWKTGWKPPSGTGKSGSGSGGGKGYVHVPGPTRRDESEYADEYA